MKKSWDRAPEVTLPGGAPAVGPYLGRVIESFSKAIIPDGGDLPVDIDETGSHQFLAAYLRDLDPGARRGMKALFIIVDLLPFLFIGRFSRFANLKPYEQELYLKDWEASRIYFRRMVLVLLKTVLGMGYYNDPKVLDHIKFSLPCGERKQS